MIIADSQASTLAGKVAGEAVAMYIENWGDGFLLRTRSQIAYDDIFSLSCAMYV